MLGHVRRTTRTDVALALVMAGIAYLAWALACWMAKGTAVRLRETAADTGALLPTGAGLLVDTFGAWPRIIFDALGPVWMLAGLYMVIRASRQHRIISWSWLLVSTQAIAAGLIATWALASHWTLTSRLWSRMAPPTDGAPIVMGVGVVIWLATLIWLIGEALRLRGLRGGPAIGDSAKTHSYRR